MFGSSLQFSEVVSPKYTQMTKNSDSSINFLQKYVPGMHKTDDISTGPKNANEVATLYICALSIFFFKTGCSGIKILEKNNIIPRFRLEMIQGFHILHLRDQIFCMLKVEKHE